MKNLTLYAAVGHMRKLPDGNGGTYPAILLNQQENILDATLSVQLKSLEEYGLIKRIQYEAIPPKVEYSLTEIGEKFHPVVAAMETWGKEYIAQMNGGDD